jgi:hypothetical protein
MLGADTADDASAASAAGERQEERGSVGDGTGGGEEMVKGKDGVMSPKTPTVRGSQKNGISYDMGLDSAFIRRDRSFRSLVSDRGF